MILFNQYLEISLRSSRKTGTDMGLEVWPTESGSVTSEIILPKPSLVSAAAKSLQSCPTLRPHRRQPIRLPCPWDYPCKNTGVGCHFLLQCMKVKSESEVAQSCPTLSDPMDCSPPGSSIHGIFQARVLEWGAITFSAYSSSYTLEISSLLSVCMNLLILDISYKWNHSAFFLLCLTYFT